MCGIAGAIWTTPRLGVEPPTLRRMTDVIRHRGPDGEGFFESELRHRSPSDISPGVALGHRRLAIIDVDGSAQPMSNEDQAIWLVFNGEVYNYRDLQHRLDGSGHQLKTRGDTETILHLYEDEGARCFKHLNGMFAIALYDANHRSLILARDRFGKKPLYYRVQDGRLAFASEIASLLELPDASRDIDPAALDAYLTYQYVPPPHSIFRDIKKLPPGCTLTWRDGRVQIQPYWAPDWNFEQSVSQAEAGDRIRELFDSAVQLRLQSEVPLGAFLSGGIDSSLVCAAAQSFLPHPLKTYSIGFHEKEFDESDHAQRVANFLKTDHQAFRVTPQAQEILPRLVSAFGEPFGDSSAIPTWYVSELTRRSVTVALSGDGGDELFLGYERYQAVDLGRRLDRAPWLKQLIASPMWQHIPSSRRQRSLLRRFKRFSESLRKPPVDRYLDWVSIFKETDRAALYRDDFLAELPPADPGDFLREAWTKTKLRDPMTAAANTDLQTYLPCDLMTKVDITSMAHSLEVRQPFLDYRLVEYCASLPKSLKYRRGVAKSLLQKTFTDRLPRATWKRRKMGFGVPLAAWFRGELRPLLRDTLLSEGAHCTRYFSSSSITQLINAHQTGAFDHSHRLWTLLFLELWLQKMTSSAPNSANCQG